MSLKMPDKYYDNARVVNISVRLKRKRQRIHTITFYLRDISTPLVGVIFKGIDQIQEPLRHKR